MKLTRMEWVEVGLMTTATATCALATGDLAWTLPFGQIVGYSAALLLGQSLIRDVVRLAVRRRDATGKKKIGCLCAESTIGVLLVVIACGLTAIGITQTMTLDRIELACLVGGLLAVGFLAKDFVVIVRREKDHGSVIVWGD